MHILIDTLILSLCFDEFVIRHISREDNEKANALAKQASGYNVTKKYFNIRNPMRIKAE